MTKNSNDSEMESGGRKVQEKWERMSEVVTREGAIRDM